MNSEGLYDTEDWSIFENIKQLFYFCKDISQYNCFYCIFDQTNAALVRIRDFRNTENWPQTFEH